MRKGCDVFDNTATLRISLSNVSRYSCWHVLEPFAQEDYDFATYTPSVKGPLSVLALNVSLFDFCISSETWSARCYFV